MIKLQYFDFLVRLLPNSCISRQPRMKLQYFMSLVQLFLGNPILICGRFHELQSRNLLTSWNGAELLKIKVIWCLKWYSVLLKLNYDILCKLSYIPSMYSELPENSSLNFQWDRLIVLTKRVYTDGTVFIKQAVYKATKYYVQY